MSRIFVGKPRIDRPENISNDRDRFWAHRSAVETIAGLPGVKVPEAHDGLIARFIDCVDSSGETATDRLISAVLHPNGGPPVSVLKSAAIAAESATASADAFVLERVREAVLEQLVAIYSPVAMDNYRKLSEAYNRAADDFSKDAKAFDLELGADQLLDVSPEHVRACSEAPAKSARLERAAHHLLAAASLCDGVPGDVAFYASGATDQITRALQISILMQINKAHIRRLYEYFVQKPGRTAGWAQMLGLGVTLVAAKNLPVTPCPQPPPLIAVQQRGGNAMHWDPLDGKIPKDMQPLPVGWLAEPIQNLNGVLP